MPEHTHPTGPLAANVGGEQRAKPVPPEPHRLVAQINAALEQQVRHVPQRQREADVHQDHQPDHLRRRIEVAKRVAGCAHPRPLAGPSLGRQVALTEPPRIYIALTEQKRPALQPQGNTMAWVATI